MCSIALRLRALVRDPSGFKAEIARRRKNAEFWPFVSGDSADLDRQDADTNPSQSVGIASGSSALAFESSVSSEIAKCAETAVSGRQ